MISAILLGAGESRRMGVNKLLLPWGKKTIFERCLDSLLRSSVKEVIVVLGGHGKEMRGQLEKSSVLTNQRVRVQMNPDYKKGMSTSIRRALLKTDPRSSGILIALGDQPLLTTRTVDALIRAFEKGKGEIIVPLFRREKGHPVIFHRKFKQELLKLKGDAGGRSILRAYPGKVGMVRIRSKGVLRDIDTWRDYHPFALSSAGRRADLPRRRLCRNNGKGKKGAGKQ